MNKQLNIVIIGVNYYGSMASAQRIRNLIDGLLLIEPITVVNIITNSICEIAEHDSVKPCIVNYNIKNPLSIWKYFNNSARVLKKAFNPDKYNILYCYGYPSIQNWKILNTAKKIGYKIAFDIVEKITVFDLTKASMKNKFKNYTSSKLLHRIPQIGSMCFGISSALVDFCNDVCKGQIPVIHLPISVNEQHIKSFKKESEKKSTIRVFYGGSFGPKDGIPLLIEGFSRAAEKRQYMELILTGAVSRHLKDSLQILIENSKAKEKIHFLGCLPTDAFYSTMVDADILCMLRVGSEYANAGFPFKLGEYLASGNAIIATRTSDVAQYLEHKKHAYLIQPDSVDEIEKAILDLVDHIELRKYLAYNSVSVANEFFSMKKVAYILYRNLHSIFR
jgi:glycosyltransferase involved in cell wall biosynthesis